MSRASDATSTRALQYARTIATLAGEQIRIRIASSASIWLNAGTRWRAARRGRHTGSSTTASSPSRRGAGAASTPRRHAGGTTSARALDGQPEAATKRSVGMGGNRRDRRGRGRDGSRPRHPLVVVAQAWLRVPVQTGIKGLQTRAPLVPLAGSGRRGYWVRW